MAKKKNSKKKNTGKEEIKEIKEIEPVITAEVAEPEGPGETDPIEMAKVQDIAENEGVDVITSDSTEEQMPDFEATDVPDHTIVLEPVGATDDTVVMEPANTDDAKSLEEELFGDQSVAVIPAAAETVSPASGADDPAAAEAAGYVTVTAPEPEAHGSGDASAKGRKKSLFSDKPVTLTRKMLAGMLAAMLILNGAITAGIMALYTHSIKDDISDVEKTVSKLESGPSSDGNGPGMGMTPPDWNSNGNDWDDYPDDDRDSDRTGGWDDDDWDDDDSFGTPYGGQYDDQQGQQNSSGVSIGIVITDNDGVYITQVTGSNAQKAGFKEGDKVISFDGETVNDSNSLISEVQKHKSGDKVKVVVERDGKKTTIRTELE